MGEVLHIRDIDRTFSAKQSTMRVNNVLPSIFDEMSFDVSTEKPKAKILSFPNKFSLQPVQEQIPLKEKQRQPNPLGGIIHSFDNSPEEYDLPEDWYTLENRVGFSMKSQMEQLKSTEPHDIAKWVKKSDYMVRGFTLEYLSPDKILYPCTYIVDPEDHTRLIDPQFGDTDIVDMVDERERKGSVKESLQKIKTFFLNGGDMTVMVSPKGPSGLKRDDNVGITYRDSFFFIKKHDEKTGAITNYTVKTDFTHQECREVIYQLTGKRLSPTAPLEEYARAIACFEKNRVNPVSSVEDVVDILEEVRWKKGSTKVFEDVNFESVYEDIENAESLYDNEIAKEMLADFRAYCLQGSHTKVELQKALAATVLRISKTIIDEEAVKDVPMKQQQWYRLNQRGMSYGSVINNLSKRGGCSNGGAGDSAGSNIMTMAFGAPRQGILEAVKEDKYGSLRVSCPSCEWVHWRGWESLIKKCENLSCKDRTAIACEVKKPTEEEEEKVYVKAA